MDELREKLKLLPDNPGVYVMLDVSGGVIYVGKAKNLKNRVRQYFHASVKNEKTMSLVSSVADFYYIITPSEVDALSLENNLIKKHKPKYNILLKDDKTYPYIKINLKEKFPAFTVTRRIKKDGCRYFGPFMGGIAVKDILEIMQLAFNIRLCATAIDEKPKKECLNYHIKRCTSPCSARVSPNDYREQVNRAADFLSGNDDTAEKYLRDKMTYFAANEEFELALEYRQKLAVLDKIKERKITSLNSFINADIIALRSNSIYIAVNVLITRKGRMQGGKYFALTAQVEGGEAVTAFAAQFYQTNELPDEIIVQNDCETALLEEYFKKNFDKSVSVINPKQGVRRQLLDMAEKNAAEHLEKQIDKIKHKDDMTKLACKRLQSVLGLSVYPKRIECFDISNISGVDKVGSMAVFIDGEPDKTGYRRFKIKTVEGADDFKSLQEVLSRRLDKLGSDEEYKFEKPDLIVIDGGKGQLSSVREIFEQKGIEDIELISLAERDEEIFTKNTGAPVVLEKSDYALRLLQRVRDEAHRFAVAYHRSLRSKRTLSSVLDEIEGVGKKKRIALLERFKSIDNILSASVSQLAEVEGIGEKLALAVKKHFEENI